MGCKKGIVLSVICLSLVFGAGFTTLLELWRNADKVAIAFQWLKAKVVSVLLAVDNYLMNLGGGLRNSPPVEPSK